MYLIEAIGPKRFRMWMMYEELLLDFNVLHRGAVKEYHNYFALLKQAGVEKIVGMIYQWFYPHSIKHDGMSVPYRDLTEGSDYMIFMDMFEQMWRTLATEFNEIDLWETEMS